MTVEILQCHLVSESFFLRHHITSKKISQEERNEERNEESPQFSNKTSQDFTKIQVCSQISNEITASPGTIKQHPNFQE